MYIHNYQIHNVLNVYRKHLSQETGTKKCFLWLHWFRPAEAFSRVADISCTSRQRKCRDFLHHSWEITHFRSLLYGTRLAFTSSSDDRVLYFAQIL